MTIPDEIARIRRAFLAFFAFLLLVAGFTLIGLGLLGMDRW
jgi:hypothetical protein